MFQFCLFYTIVNAVCQKKIRFPLAFGASAGENIKRDMKIEAKQRRR
jgi:hypothetical protein